MKRLISTAISVLALAAIALPAQAQYYKGKRITVVINYGAGGPTDVEGRLIARHLAKHIPGKPKVIVKNRPGAGGIVGTNFMGQVAKPDGMTVAIFTPPIISQVLEDPGLKVDFSKFIWLAGVGQPQICYMRKDAAPGINTVADILKAKKFKAAGMRNTSSHDMRLRLSLDLLGADYKYVTGYRGLAKVTAGVLQNETQYSCGSVPNYRSMVEPNLIKTGKAITLFYYSPTDPNGNEIKFADLKGIPTFLDVYKQLRGGAPSGVKYDALKIVNNLSTFMLRGSFVPAGTPKAAVDALRAAWQALPGDVEFVGEYRKAFKAEPKILQSDVAQAHVNNVKGIDPKMVEVLKKFIKGS
ncbi:MAG: tripartite tricarboxylate transporter substrate-binding protein [Pseudomonadota bacterium]|nr:tripartite tricarboxylate transporter substrate-binding protein [Pseudomonadota bacterium]